MNPQERLVLILKFIGFYLGLIIASLLVWKGVDIANTIFLLDGMMLRDLYRSHTGKNAKP